MRRSKDVDWEAVTISPEVREKVERACERVFMTREAAERIIAAEPRGTTVYCGPALKGRTKSKRAKTPERK